MALERSEKAKKAKAVFFRPFNDVDIYVEDTAKGNAKFYAVIFERALGGEYRVDTVFPLGGKDAVLRNCANDQSDGGRRRLYVVDGDLDLLLGKTMPGLKRLLVIPRYSIENYLIDEDAIISMLDEEDVNRTRDEIAAKFAYKDWINGNLPALFDLFIVYAIAREKCPEVRTVGHPVTDLISSDTGVVDAAKSADRIADIRAHIELVVSRTALEERIEQIKSTVAADDRRLISYVSGKDYLLPLIVLRMRKTTKVKSHTDVIRQRLAMKCDVSELTSAQSLIDHAS